MGLRVDGQQLIILNGKVDGDDGLGGQHFWLQLHELLQMWNKDVTSALISQKLLHLENYKTDTEKENVNNFKH